MLHCCSFAAAALSTSFEREEGLKGCFLFQKNNNKESVFLVFFLSQTKEKREISFSVEREKEKRERERPFFSSFLVKERTIFLIDERERECPRVDFKKKKKENGT